MAGSDNVVGATGPGSGYRPRPAPWPQCPPVQALDDRARSRATSAFFIVRRTEPLSRALDRLQAEERAGFLAGLTAWGREVQR
ncbi:hypothetical protein V7793_06375 [Streptomyces sp. KLMMK]|uniref:hypothetical protein n=1 Tax=Streptomyces sp. KLMMK TaxID=3109353 RepID=UPI003000AB28